MMMSGCLFTVLVVDYAVQKAHGGIFLRQYGFHISKLFFEGVQHLLAYLKLNCTWMVLDCKCIITEVLYEQLILRFIFALPHLQDHVLISLDLSLFLFNLLFLRVVAI